MLSLGFTTTHFRTTLPSIPQNKPFSSLATTCPLPTKTNKSIFYPCIFSPTKSAKVNSISASSNIDSVVAKEYVEEEKQELLLPAGLRPELMPKHVAVFMDGHRRWARGRGLPVEDGHRAGGEKIKEIARLCSNFGVKVLSVFAFSAGSWTRPKEELDFLMKMFERPLMADMQEALKMNIRGSIIGDTSVFSNSLQRMISLGVAASKDNTEGLHVIGALNYSGRYDITQACKSIANKVKDGLLQPQDINESIFEEELETKCTEFPSPDLFIRTSGEHRISNFMLWQMAYSELYFVDKLFPDFEEGDFVEALKSFQKRDRRYGGQKH